MLRWLIGISLRNPYIVALLTLTGMAVGGWSATRLPIDAVPDITNRQVQINTLMPSLSPEEVEAQVTFPIETALAGTPGLASTRSLSRNGFSQVTAIFRDDTDIYFARQQLTERLSAARETLPTGADPRLGPNATGLGEVYWWTLSYAPKPAPPRQGPGWQANGTYMTPDGDILATPLEQATYLRTLQDWTIRPRLLDVAGVAGVDSQGGYVRQLEVQPDPGRLIAYGVTLDELATALEGSNIGTGAGYLESRGASYLVRADSRFRTAADVAKAVVATRGSTPITVGDIAKVVPGREQRTGSASANGEEVVLGIGLMRIGANSRTVAAALDSRLQEILPSLPPDIKVTPILNRTKLVNATIETVATNLAEGALLVVAVLFLTIGNLRAAVITALVIPLAMLMTMAGMVEANVSANLMSLGALDFGLIVDGAIIIVENGLRHLGEEQRRLGRSLTRDERRDIVARSTYEMIRPSVYGQIIILIVYVPVLLLTGVEGKMFHPMAITVVFALASAFVLSLTVIPTLILAFLGRHEEREGYIARGARLVYGPLLQGAFEHSSVVFVVAVLLVAGSVAVFLSLGQEFIPSLDEFDVAAETRKIPSVNLSQSTDMQRVTERALSTLPEVAVVLSKTGTAELATDPVLPNSSDVYVILKPRAAWPDPNKPKSEIIERLRTEVERVPGTSYEFSQPIQLRFNELLAGVKSDLGIKVFGDDLTLLHDVAGDIADVLAGVRGAADVKVEQTVGQPIVVLRPRRDAVARYGVKPMDIHETLAAAVGGRVVGQIYEGTLHYPLVLRFADAYRKTPGALHDLPVPLPASTQSLPPLTTAATVGEARRQTNFIPLAEVAEFEVADAANQISREKGRRRVVVTANIRNRDLGSTVNDAKRQIAAKVQLPPGVWLEWGGQIENLQSAQGTLLVVVPLCLVAILGLLYGAIRSAIEALIVFTGVPLALTGGIFGLWVAGLPFSISAAVGFIALSGVAVLNGLVLASSINGLIAEGMDRAEACRRGAVVRLRPVLMTMLVASFGFVPMAFATGAGAEVQRPLAVVVIGGLITSTALTLIVLPTLYRRLFAFTNPSPGRS
jgi:cobalt-zinc-cadmium resistance protein CzcA